MSSSNTLNLEKSTSLLSDKVKLDLHVRIFIMQALHNPSLTDPEDIVETGKTGYLSHYLSHNVFYFSKDKLDHLNCKGFVR